MNRPIFAVILFLSALGGVGSLSAQCVSGTNASLQLDGNDHVTIPAPGAVLSAFTDFTIEAWFRTSAGGDQVFFSSQDYSGSQGGLRFMLIGGSLHFASIGSFLSAPGGFNNGIWHHGVVSRTGTIVTMYVDGVNILTTVSGAPTTVSAIPATLGCILGGGTPSWRLNGFLDEVRVWNIGRTLAQINSTRFGVLNGNEPGLVGYWRLNEGAGQFVANSATATPGIAAGTLGASSAVSTDDPAWSFATTAPITQCAPGTGQPNSAAASLRVNGVGDLGANGPHTVMVPTSGPGANSITFTWQGPALSPLILLAGNRQANAAIIPCSGSLDLSFTGLTIVGDFFTSPFPLNYLFVLDGNGSAQTTFTVPAAVLGTPWVSLQGAVYAPTCPNIPYLLTAAFTIQ